MSSKDYFRPRGDITTVLDLTDRDSQDNTYFPIDAEQSWFHRTSNQTVYPTAMSIQEFTQRGPSDWGQTFSFELGSLPAGDLLQGLFLQMKLGSWYDNTVLNRLLNSVLTTDTTQFANQYWTYINGLGTSIIEYADFIVSDQTIERITGEFIQTHMTLNLDLNASFGLGTDSIGLIPPSYLNPSVVGQTMFSPNRPYPTEDGTYFCVLPFFFLRTKLKEVFPLLSCNEGNVRVDVRLRPFSEVVRKYIGYRANCTDVPLNQSVSFVSTALPTTTSVVSTASQPPPFRDFRILTACSLTEGSLRQKFLRQPFEQMVKLVQNFSFEEPLKYIVSKPNVQSGTVEIQLPLELNHPVVELMWVFRRKGVRINNEWSNFTPALGFESSPTKVFPPWLQYATLRINGSEVIAADGDWFRQDISQKHDGGLTSYRSPIYGYSFASYPQKHQPSGTANMSRSTSVSLNLTVNIPIATDLSTLPGPCVFDPVVTGGWEVFVFAMYYNWIRFENGVCNRVFSS